MATFDEAIIKWAADINSWYGLNATTGEVQHVFNSYFKDKKAYDETSYVDMFLKCDDGSWTLWLDTADREELADQVEIARGNQRLPTYSDLGGNLLNKVMKS